MIMPRIDIEKEIDQHLPYVGASYLELYPFSNWLNDLRWTPVQELSESEALKLALDRTPKAVVTLSGKTVEYVAAGPHPGAAWANRSIVVVYETKSYLFAIAQCDRQWDLVMQKKRGFLSKRWTDRRSKG
jgi:hypothetical protein